MPILSDSEIMKLVSGQQLFDGHFVEKNLTPNGYDLTVDRIRIDGSEADTADAIIPPRTSFLVSTREFLNLPNDVVGELWIRSSYARKGIIASYGVVDAGYRGNLTLSFYNASSRELPLKQGDRITQIVFITLIHGSEKNYAQRSGNYQDKTGISI